MQLRIFFMVTITFDHVGDHIYQNSSWENLFRHSCPYLCWSVSQPSGTCSCFVGVAIKCLENDKEMDALTKLGAGPSQPRKN
ncbi:hypothetical protein K7X08_032106 [Anisodus acutangulus]|uniref:Uncharacterized protein n=1 Tax=Anisodus acutangulus TaxID=402998 RepID=A0A9Q1MRC1_9SOLA|nr:hypothetical protein K7X08_032106 [Anisodus acutangulus]